MPRESSAPHVVENRVTNRMLDQRWAQRRGPGYVPFGTTDYAVKKLTAREREWCAAHSEPRVVCGCESDS